jgi:hypothetical protein
MPQRKSPVEFWLVRVSAVTALQYFGRPVLTYESGSTRRFAYGRTECIRSATVDSHAFATAMVAWMGKRERGVATPEEAADVAKLLRYGSRALVHVLMACKLHP